MNISVIVPTFNRAHTLARALDSVLAQTYQAKEIIVIDDASSDNTTELLLNYPDIKLLNFDTNLGVSAARNAGIARSKSDWVAFLDSDDEWLPQKLQRQVDIANTDSNMLIFHTDEIWVRNGKRVNPMNKHAKPDGSVYEESLPLCCVSPSSILLKREVLGKCGVFDETLPACEDYDLWLRLFSRYPVKLIDEQLLIKYGGHGDQLSHQFWGMDRFRVRALCKILESGVLNEKQRAQTKITLHQKCQVLAKGATKRNKAEMANHYKHISAQYGGDLTS